MTMSREQASTRGRIGAHVRWSRENDRVSATEAARSGLRARFEREVDPNGELDPAERAIRADHAFKAHMLRLSMKSAATRAARAST